MNNTSSLTKFLIIGIIIFVLIGTKNQLALIQRVKDTFKTVESTLPTDNGGGESNSQVESEKVVFKPNKENFDESRYSSHSQEVINYFKQVTMGREFDSQKNYIKRWNTDVKIYVKGETNSELNSELNRIVSDLNDIIETINFKVVSDPSQANMVVFFGSYTTFHNLNPDISLNVLEGNWGLFSAGTNNAVLYVDTHRANTQEQKHLLREELTQSLGLFNDTYDYPNSIFYQGWTTTTEYSNIDRELIDMLYNE